LNLIFFNGRRKEEIFPRDFHDCPCGGQYALYIHQDPIPLIAVARGNSNSLRSKLTRGVTGFFYKTIFEQKLNNWFGYLLMLSIAGLLGLALASDLVTGLTLFGVVVAFCLVVLCLRNPETGFFMLMFFCYFSSFFSTLLFGGNLPTGILFDALVLLIFLGLIVRIEKFKPTWRHFVKLPLVAFILFTLCYNLVQIFNPNSRPSSTDVLAFRKFVGYVLILFAAYSLFDNYERIRRYIFALFAISVICAIYGCIQQWHGLFNFELEPILADPHAMGLLFANGEFRKFSTMPDPTAFGILMAVGTVFFLILAIYEKSTKVRVLYVIGSVFMVLGMGYSGTRTANATLVAGVGFFILLNLDKKGTRIFGAVAAVMFVVLLFGPGGNISTIRRFRTTFQGSKDESYKVRVLSRAWIQPYIRSHPIGGGLGTTGFNGAIEHPGHYLANFQPDSSYVKRAAETGWIGLAIVCILYGFTLIEAIKAFFRARDERLRVVYAACASSLFSFYVAEFAQVAIGSITDVIVYYPIVAIILRSKTNNTDAQATLPA
jgi:cell division protein FtsW (lipid II flippase)